MLTYSWVVVYHRYHGTIYNNHIVLFGSQTGGKKLLQLKIMDDFMLTFGFLMNTVKPIFILPTYGLK